MALEDAERERIGTAIRMRRRTRFGTAKAAYEAAQVSPTTWEKAEAGGSIREDRLAAIVRALWPETEGDWTAIPSLGPSQQDAGYVSSSVSEQVEGGKQDNEVLQAITAMSATLDQLVASDRDRTRREGERDSHVDARFEALEARHRELSERVAQLEKPRP